jgi:hypothetical protein
MKTRANPRLAVFALFLIPAAAWAWEAGRPAGSPGADGDTRCPAMQEKGCPASSKIELSQLAEAAKQGCPYSTTQLIEMAQRSADEKTAKLARQAAEGDEEAKQRLIQRIKRSAQQPPEPVDPKRIA